MIYFAEVFFLYGIHAFKGQISSISRPLATIRFFFSQRDWVLKQNKLLPGVEIKIHFTLITSPWGNSLTQNLKGHQRFWVRISVWLIFCQQPVPLCCISGFLTSLHQTAIKHHGNLKNISESDEMNRWWKKINLLQRKVCTETYIESDVLNNSFKCNGISISKDKSFIMILCIPSENTSKVSIHFISFQTTLLLSEKTRQ